MISEGSDSPKTGKKADGQLMPKNTTEGKLQVQTAGTRKADDGQHPGTEIQRAVFHAGSGHKGNR